MIFLFFQWLLPGLPRPLPGGSDLMCRKMRVNHLRLHFHLLWICSLCFVVVTFITIIIIIIVLIMIFGKLPDAAVFTLRANYDPSFPCQCNDKCPQYGSFGQNLKWSLLWIQFKKSSFSGNCCIDYDDECGGGGGGGKVLLKIHLV